MYTVTKRLEISAAHKLALDYQSPCTRLHGHNWIIEITCQAKELNEHGMLVDFKHIKNTIEQELDHQYLNDMFDFNPTAENMAVNFAQTLNYVFSQYEGVKLISVKLWETEHNCAEVILN